MSNVVKVTDDELKLLRSTQEEYLELTQQLGEFQYQVKLIEKNIMQILDRLSVVDDKRVNIVSQLESKYGVGSVDLQTGEFIK